MGEPHLQLSRLDRIEEEAAGWGAESWIAFCYVILKGHYEEHFSTIVTLDGMRFGAKLIRTSHFRSNMRPRSPSWQAVDLPRESVIELTCDLENV